MVVELLVGGLAPALLGDEELAVPHLVDSEVLNALRGLVLRDALDQERAAVAVDGFTRITLSRFSAETLRPRIWGLRHNLSADDATYVALAETIGATALLTTDARLGRAPGLECQVRVLRDG